MISHTSFLQRNISLCLLVSEEKICIFVEKTRVLVENLRPVTCLVNNLSTVPVIIGNKLSTVLLIIGNNLSTVQQF
jgi:hypothetical protein